MLLCYSTCWRKGLYIFETMEPVLAPFPDLEYLICMAHPVELPCRLRVQPTFAGLGQKLLPFPALPSRPLSSLPQETSLINSLYSICISKSDSGQLNKTPRRAKASLAGGKTEIQPMDNVP